MTCHDRDFNAAQYVEIAGQFLLSTESDARKVTPKRYDSHKSFGLGISNP